MVNKFLSDIYRVICDQTRWHIVEYLKFHKNVSTQELAEFAHCDTSTLSFHLAKMKKVNLLKITKKGKNLFYNINFDTLNKIYNFMDAKINAAFKATSCYEFTKDQILEFYALYADSLRVKILDLIISRPGITGKEIKIKTGESEANISFHIKKLIEGHIIGERKIRNQHYYWANLRVLYDFHIWIGRTRSLNY